MAGRKQLNIKFQPDELEALRKAKEASGMTYHDLLLQGAGVKSGSRPEKPESQDPETTGRAGANPEGLDANPDTAPEDQFDQPPEDSEPGEETTQIRAEVAQALRENTKFLERTSLQAAAKEIRESYTWSELNQLEKQTLVAELDGLEQAEQAKKVADLAETFEEDPAVISEYMEKSGSRLVDLTGDQLSPQVLDALKRDKPILPFLPSSLNILASVQQIGQSSNWAGLQDVDRAHLLSHVTEREEGKLPEIARLLETDEETLRVFRARIIRTGENSYRLRPETKST